MKKLSLLLVAASLIFVLGCQSEAPLEPSDPGPVLEETSYRLFDSDELGEISAPYDFQAEIPADWQVEYIEEIEAINFYDPSSDGASTLEQSQIFVRYFEASSFLTLSTVTIYSQTEKTIGGQPAVAYDIEKNEGVADFEYQPFWRNARHFVTDIRSTDDSSTVFYIFAQRPDLDSDIFEAFLESVIFNPIELYYPLEPFEERITLKPFGIYITPETSPVSPERFSGYHTGVDLEATEEEKNVEVEIVAIAEGHVEIARYADGYGGVVVIVHEIGGDTYTAVYGHLDEAALKVAVGDTVKGGQVIGVLGEGYSDETDGERKHLHFALLEGENLNLRGYVSSEGELAGWIDPVQFFKENGL